MSKVAKKPATYDDLLKVPDHLVAEIVEGELYASPRPGGPHARAMAAIDRRIGTRFDDGDGGPGGWWIAIEPEVHLGHDVFVPDLAGWRRERVPEYLSGAYWKTAPDWICEVLSPSTARLDRIVKLPKYARHEVNWAWLVDPALQTLEVLRLVSGHWSLVSSHSGEETVRAEPFDAVDFPLRTLWIHSPAA